MDAEITVELPAVPEVETTISILPILLIPDAPDGGIMVAFPEEFEYKPPPRPTIERCALSPSLSPSLSHTHTCLHTMLTLYYTHAPTHAPTHAYTHHANSLLHTPR